MGATGASCWRCDTSFRAELRGSYANKSAAWFGGQSFFATAPYSCSGQPALLRAAGEQEDIGPFFARVTPKTLPCFSLTVLQLLAKGPPSPSPTKCQSTPYSPASTDFAIPRRWKRRRTGKSPPARLLHAGGLSERTPPPLVQRRRRAGNALRHFVIEPTCSTSARQPRSSISSESRSPPQQNGRDIISARHERNVTADIGRG